MNRRNLLKSLAAGVLVWHSPVFSMSQQQNKKNCVWIILRGAMDGISAVTPVFDPYLKQHRPDLLKPSEQMLNLDGQYQLHPALKHLHTLFENGQLLPVVATSSGYERRSHFDAQDYLESGLGQIDHDSGWLARLSTQGSKQSLAVAQSLPISLRDSTRYPTWYPSRFPDVEEELYQQLDSMYSEHPMLSSAISELMKTKTSLGKTSQGTSFKQLAATCGKIITQKEGPDCAMLELGGWDTHNNQSARLDQKFKQLDDGIKALHSSLGEQWDNTVVIIATEFGRTVRQNGTQGTDHGTASTLFMCGGAINGGRVAGEWLGTAPDQLYENRDLKPTSHHFDWIGTLLSQHWQLPQNKVKAALPTYHHLSDTLIN